MSKLITKNDLTNILNEVSIIDSTDMTSQEVTQFVNSLEPLGDMLANVKFSIISVTSESTTFPSSTGTWVEIPVGTLEENQEAIGITGWYMYSCGTCYLYSNRLFDDNGTLKVSLALYNKQESAMTGTVTVDILIAETVYEFPNTVDYVVDEGSSTESGPVTWKWRKWNSGLVDLWGVSTDTEEPYNANAQMGYWYSHRRTLTFPFPIKDVSASYSVGCGVVWAVPSAAFPYGHDNSPDFITSSTIYSLVSASSSAQVTYKITAKARWK